ncbi:DUF2332 domain-containing protein [Nocardia sp. NEAU-G5]|uniref:DUF2332 domain-containing protein n=1 Tax=Nocardia albiluteola TaxID=2842303 RepID=A0ABS6APK6_9NOCA|nr:DUF2332 domain-containing protein [Nocardia albiluteola]MBU3059952.1 DUF2332 domain-containing protein [Nocardia albiluteola]
MTLISQFEYQSRAADALGSSLYAILLAEIARDIEAAGPCARAVAGFEDSHRDSALPLRFVAAVHALVLSGEVPELARYYPSAGPEAAPPDAGLWPAFREVVAAQTEWIAAWLDTPPRAPQTNDVGRAVPLLAGLLAAVDATPLPIRLLELGSSAGLNLRADQFRWHTGDLDWGPRESPVVLGDAWREPVPSWLVSAVRGHPTVRVVERRGCDLAPIDPLSPHGALALRSYVWPDQIERMTRLDGALRLAERVPAEVITSGAAEFLAGIDLVPGALTIVWHSVMRQYVDPKEWQLVAAELDRLAAASGPDAGFAHIAFEPQLTRDDRNGFRLTARIGKTPETVLARAMPHGIPAFVRSEDQ